MKSVDCNKMVRSFKIKTLELKNIVDFCMLETEKNIMKHNVYKKLLRILGFSS
mgnify:CR=1 FL=1